MRISNKSAYGSKSLGDNRVISGGKNGLIIANIKSLKVDRIEDYTFSGIFLIVLKNEKVIFGNYKGEVFSYDILSNQVSKNKFHIGKSINNFYILNLEN